VRDRRFWAFFLITVVAMFIKWDAIVLPALFLLANSSRQNAHKVLLQSVAAGAASLAIYVALRVLIPGGFEPYDLFAQMQRNLGQIAAGPFSYAPFLAFGLPVLFAIIGYQDSDRFMRACVWFAGLITIPMFILTNFEEARAEMMLLPLLAPAALLGIRRFGVWGAA
jgi:hypothetical protein